MNPQEQALLQQLHDIVTPGQPGWWPIAIGWWIVAALLIALLLVVRKLVKGRAVQREQRRWRDAAMLEHKRLRTAMMSQDDIHSSTELADLSILMRRVALAVMPRQQVAALTDDQWLVTLDALGKTDEYTRGVGTLLHRVPYKKDQTVLLSDLQYLLDLTEDTIARAGPLDSGVVDPDVNDPESVDSELVNSGSVNSQVVIRQNNQRGADVAAL